MISKLADVAAVAGVSVATASRALTGGKVSDATRQRVRESAESLGYVANEGARSLRGDRTMTMGVVFMNVSNLLALELLEALTDGVEEHGYNLFISTARGQEERYDTLVQRFFERRVDALFCVNAAGNGDALSRFEAAGRPVTGLFHTSGGYSGLPLISPSTSEAARAAVGRLGAYGHKSLGVVRPHIRSGPIETFIELAKAAGMAVQIYEPNDGHFDPVQCLQAVLNGSVPPTVVLGQQAHVSALLEAADELHIIVPRDLSLIAIRDRSLPLPGTRLPMSMIHLNPERVGRTAADVVCGWLGRDEERASVQVELGSWIERGTTGPAPSQRRRAV